VKKERQTERVILSTDDEGRLVGVPVLPPRARVAVALRVLDRSPPISAPRFTSRQGQFLAFIRRYTERYGQPPAEADMARHFMIWPESAHQMVVTLERRGLIAREPGRARSIRVLLSAAELPELE